MNRDLWVRGYRDALMDTLHGTPLVNAAKNMRNLAPDFVSGANAAGDRCAELVEFRDTDPLEFQRLFGRGLPPDWAMSDAHASVEASMAWDELQRVLARAEDLHLEIGRERDHGIGGPFDPDGGHADPEAAQAAAEYMGFEDYNETRRLALRGERL